MKAVLIAVLALVLLVCAQAQTAYFLDAEDFVGTWYTVPNACTSGTTLGTCCCNVGTWTVTGSGATFTTVTTASNAAACPTASGGVITTQYDVSGNSTCPYPSMGTTTTSVGSLTIVISAKLVTPGQMIITNSFFPTCISYACRNLSDALTCPKAIGATVSPSFTTACDAPTSSSTAVVASSSTGTSAVSSSTATDVTVYDTAPFVGSWLEVPRICTPGRALAECCCYSGTSTVTRLGVNAIGLVTGVSGGAACLDSDVFATNFTVISATTATSLFFYGDVPVTFTLSIAYGGSTGTQFTISPSILPACISYGCRGLDNSTTCPALNSQRAASSSSTGGVDSASSAARTATAACTGLLVALVAIIATKRL